MERGSTSHPAPSWRYYLYFLRLGTFGFGGPIALAGFMQRDLVDTRGWISREDYTDGLALAQLAPGPLAAQLAMYLGYVRGGFIGATIVSVAFILPSFLMVWVISVAYVRFGGLPWMQAAFYGVGAAVVAIIARSVHKLAKITLRRDTLLWIIGLGTAAVTIYTEREIASVFVLAGVLTMWASRRTSTTVTRGATMNSIAMLGFMATPAATSTPVVSSVSLSSVFWLFAKAGTFVFGSGLAIVPFIYGELVETRAWLSDRQFLDAVAVAMITPGPVVITVAFIGYLVAGTSGMVAASIGVFLPVYLFVIIPAPFFRRHRHQPAVKAFVEGVSGAATGAIAGAAVVLATRSLLDVWTLGLAVATIAVLSRWKISELWAIGAAALVGLALHS